MAKIRVLYADTDQMGVVNNVVYLRWFEIGRAEWLRQHGRPYKELEALGHMLPVVEAHLRYREPARYDDIVDVHGGAERRPRRVAEVLLRAPARARRRASVRGLDHARLHLARRQGQALAR